jgi:hypothetical protein
VGRMELAIFIYFCCLSIFVPFSDDEALNLFFPFSPHVLTSTGFFFTRTETGRDRYGGGQTYSESNMLKT